MGLLLLLVLLLLAVSVVHVRRIGPAAGGAAAYMSEADTA
jgi:hypothetical protein